MVQSTGFKYVTTAGMTMLMKLLTHEGSAALLNAYSNKAMVNTLMLTPNFNITAYCWHKGSSVVEVENLRKAVHAEILDALFGIVFAFTQGMDCITCPAGERSISGLTWVPTPETVLNTLAEVSAYAQEAISEADEIFVRVVADITADDSTDGQEPQSLEFRLSGAGDFQVLEAVVSALLGWGYKLKYIIE